MASTNVARNRCRPIRPKLFAPVAILALAVSSLPALAADKAASGGLSPQGLQALTQAMQQAVDRGEAPGIVTMIYRHGEIAHVSSVGWRDVERKLPMQRDSIFRLASMSKPLVAVAALILVDDGKLDLNAPVDNYLPEMADRQVLLDPNGPLTATRPASRSIRLSDLLTHRSGLTPGRVRAGGELQSPIAAAMTLADEARKTGPDEWIRRVGALPLAYDPGTKFEYGVSFDLLAVLIARASGMSLEEFMRTRLFEPLGMKDTSFSVPASKQSRLAVAYEMDPRMRKLRPRDERLFDRVSPPNFPSGEGGLFSTADDYLQAARMLLGKGRMGDVKILSHRVVALMTTNYLTPEQRNESADTSRHHAVPWREWFAGQGFGLGVSVVDNPARQDEFMGYSSRGSFGWGGALGTWWQADPEEDMIQLFMVQLPTAYFGIRPIFQKSSYRAIDD